MARSDSEGVVLAFNGRINAGDVVGLASLMTRNHVFIDSAGTRLSGRATCRRAWERFFESFPDYRNHFESLATTEDRVTILGRSTCSDPRLEGRAIWTARIRGGKVAEWRVYEDTPDRRASLEVGW